jgi:hypothetical protein
MRKAEGRGAMAGDSSRTRMWWFKNGRTYTFAAAVAALGAGIVAVYLTLYSHLHFNAGNPVWIVLLVIVWLVGLFGIGSLVGWPGRPERSWRPLVAVLAEWAKDHGGAEDPIAAQMEVHRRVVRAAASDERSTVWSAHAAPLGYPIRLLLHGVSGEYGSSEGELRGRKGDVSLPKIHYTLMAADTGVELPGIVVAVPKTDPDDFLLPDYTKRIEFESLEFNDRWEVRCVDVSIGHKVFDPRTIEILLELEATDIRILWEGTSVVIAREGADVDAAELDRWLALIDRMVHNARLIGRSA